MRAWIGIAIFCLVVSVSVSAAPPEPELPVPDIQKMLDLRAEEVGDNKPVRIARDQYRLDLDWHGFRRSLYVRYEDGQWHQAATDYRDPYGAYFHQLWVGGNIPTFGFIDCRVAGPPDEAAPAIRRVYCSRGPNAVQRGIDWQHGKIFDIRYAENGVCIEGGPDLNRTIECWKDGQEKAAGAFPNPLQIKEFFAGGGLTPRKNEVCALYMGKANLFCWSPDQGFVEYSQYEDFVSTTYHVCFIEKQPIRRRVCGVFDYELRTQSHFRADSIWVLDADFVASHAVAEPGSMACDFAGGHGCWGESSMFYLVDYIQQNLAPIQIVPGKISVCYFSASEIGCLRPDQKKIKTLYREPLQPQESVLALVNFDHTIAVLKSNPNEVQYDLTSEEDPLASRKNILSQAPFFSGHKLIGIRQGKGHELCIQDQLGDVMRESCAYPVASWPKTTLHILSPTRDKIRNIIENEFVACGDYANAQLCWPKTEGRYAERLLAGIDQLGPIRYLVATGPTANTPDACVSDGQGLKCVATDWINQPSVIYDLFNIDDALCVASDQGASCWGTPNANQLGRFLPQNLDVGLKALSEISLPIKSKFYFNMANFLQSNVPRDQFSARYHLLLRIQQLVGASGHSALEAGFTKEIEADLKRADTLRTQITSHNPLKTRADLVTSAKILQEGLSLIVGFTSDAENRDLSNLYPALGRLFANPSAATISSAVEQLDARRELLTKLEYLSKLYPILQTVKTEQEWLRQQVERQ